MLSGYRKGLVVTLVLLLAVVLILASVGESGPPLRPVSGKVIYPDGRPVTSGVIEFAPVDGSPPARGKIESDGRFSLKTGNKSGAVAGVHRIAIVQIGAGSPTMPGHKHKGITVDRNYARFESSGLVREVRMDAPNEFEIEVDATR